MNNYHSKLYNGIYWAVGLLLIALGIALCTKADLGLSMISAPPFILHTYVEKFWPWFTQGRAEIFFQSFVFIIMCIYLRSFKPRYMLSFVTGVISGKLIDLNLALLGGPDVYESLPVRIIAFLIGANLISLAIACFFRTNWPPQSHELFVMEVSAYKNWITSSFKWIYDFCCLFIALCMCLFLTKSWQGVGVGTVIVTFSNAPLIAMYGRQLSKIDDKIGVRIIPE